MLPFGRIVRHRNSGLRLFVSTSALLFVSVATLNAAQRMRWDLISVNFSTSPITASAGGMDSAFANDNSSIVLTGSGTFLYLGSTTRFSALALGGGGTWQTFAPTGVPTGNGTYTVLRGPANFQPAPGIQNPLNDRVGNLQDQRAGLLILEIRYSDGSRGILNVSCHLPLGTPPTPDSVFEGITVTKGFVDYWKRFEPVAGVDANRTNFHVLP